MVNAQQEVLLKPRRIDLDDFPAWAEAHLGSADAAVLEAAGNAWYLHDLLAPLVGRCVVANSLQVKWIAALHRLSTSTPWAELAPYLVQLPGFGLLTAMAVLSAIGDVSCFPNDKQLVGYAGLGAGVHDSGETHRDHGITKQGRRDLRRVLIEVAWSAVNSHPYWEQEFARMTRRKHPNVAITAIARRLLVAVWRVLTERAADRHAEPPMVAFKLMVWSWQLNDVERAGISSRQFIRYHLLRLGLGNDLTPITTGRATRRAIAPPKS